MFTCSHYRTSVSSLLIFGLLALGLAFWPGCSDKSNPVTPPDPNPTSEVTCQITGATPGSGTAPLQVAFTGTAAGGTAPYTYAWRFGDGSSAKTRTANHIFQSAGTFSVQLIVEDSRGDSDTGTVSISVSAPNQLTCTASASIVSGTAPLAVIFNGGASGGTAPYAYSWSFGDGATSSLQNSNHTYTSPGTYTARLTVTDATAATTSKTITITVTGTGLNCTVSANPTSGQAPLAVSFTGNASGGQPPYGYSWTFGDGSTSSSQNPSHTYNTAGSYTAQLTVRDGAAIECSKSIGITVVSQLVGPKLSGPGSSTGSIDLTWGFTWPPLAATGEGFSVEQSTVSSNSGFSEIAQIPRGDAMRLTINRAPGTYYFRVRAYVNQGVAPGWTQYSNSVTVTVTSPVSRTRFVNNSSYVIVSLIVDNVQYFVQSPQGILPGHYFEIDLTPGTHSYRMVNGFWNGYSRFEMYILQGTVSQRSGQTEIINFNNPTVNQILTQFNSSGYWEGSFWQNLQPHVAGFRFYSNGTWRLYVDGVQQSTGTYTLVSRSPGTFSLTFSIGSYTGTLYETYGKFTMRNGPADWPLIEYFYEGP